MEVLNKLRAICEAATPGMFPAENRYRDAVIKAAPALIELVEALEWERECREFYSENHYTYMPANYELLATMTAATAAVEAAKAKLEAVL